MTADDLARLTAGLRDDEMIARTAAELFASEGRKAKWVEISSGILDIGDEVHALSDATLTRHIEQFDPARALRQVEAIRKALADVADPKTFDDHYSGAIDYTSFREGVEAAAHLFTCALASIYTEDTETGNES